MRIEDAVANLQAETQALVDAINTHRAALQAAANKAAADAAKAAVDAAAADVSAAIANVNTRLQSKASKAEFDSLAEGHLTTVTALHALHAAHRALSTTHRERLGTIKTLSAEYRNLKSAYDILFQRVKALEDKAGVAPSTPNQPPTFTMPSSFRMNERSEATLTITDARDPEGRPVSYKWSQIIGPRGTLRNDTTSTVTFVAPDVAGDTMCRLQCDVSDPEGLITSKTVDITVVDVPVQQPGDPQIETRFNSQYPSGWVALRDSNDNTRPSRSQPAKSADIMSGGYIDDTTKAIVRRVTDAALDTGVTADMRHSYSTQAAFNADNTRFLSRRGSRWFLYDANTLKVLNGRNPSVANAIHWEHPDYGTSGVLAEGGVDATWDPVDPNVVYYGGNNESRSSPMTLGTKWMKRTFNADGSGTSVLWQDFGPIVNRLFGSSARSVSFRGDGRPSDDGRYWAFIVESAVKNSLGFFCWDAQEKKVCGFHKNPVTTWYDTIRMSPCGNYVVVHHEGSSPSSKPASRSSALTNFNDPALGHGIFAFRRNDAGEVAFDKTHAFCISVESSHGDCGRLPDGRSVFVWAYYDNASKDGFPSSFAGTPAAMILDENKGNEVGVNVWSYQEAKVYGNSAGGMAFHFSGCNTKKRGWVFANNHFGVGGAKYDGMVFAMELKPTSPRLLKLAWHYTTTGAASGSYFGEPHVCVNKDATRALFASTFGTSLVSDFCVVLPSTGIPNAT